MIPRIQESIEADNEPIHYKGKWRMQGVLLTFLLEVFHEALKSAKWQREVAWEARRLDNVFLDRDRSRQIMSIFVFPSSLSVSGLPLEP